MSSRIVVFGATGYTGRLVAERLVAGGAAPVIAGRSADKLGALSDRLGGLDTRVADVDRPDAMAALVERGDVLVSTVGPFARWGEPAVRGAIEAGAVYVDSTGEPPFIRRVFSEWDAPARATRATLLTAMGYDFVPGALAAALALREPGAEAAVRVDVGYYALGGGPASLSRGTRASIAGIALSPSFAFRAGAIRTVRSAERMRSFDVKGKPRPAISVGGSEHFTVPPGFPRLREVNVFLGWFGPLARGITATSRATAVAGKVPGLKQAIVAGAGKLAGMGDAPAEGTTPGGLSWIAAAAYDEAGDQVAEVHLSGADGYAFTAGMLAWAARRLADEGTEVTGATGPLEVFGVEALEQGVADAGITRTGS
ncbi:MAG TPA: saccharopine dehydrogenase NADP-binding domain-containing protein [Solirubrobacteraceae bacterium]|nr:saccharopine dehydrogenase NADP-binding domain-containing protein [Solirubrobacteraceae bacterium]